MLVSAPSHSTCHGEVEWLVRGDCGATVDSCRVWESHSDPDGIATVNCESDAGKQLGDCRTRERMKSVIQVQPMVVETESQEPVVENKEDSSMM